MRRHRGHRRRCPHCKRVGVAARRRARHFPRRVRGHGRRNQSHASDRRRLSRHSATRSAEPACACVRVPISSTAERDLSALGSVFRARRAGHPTRLDLVRSSLSRLDAMDWDEASASRRWARRATSLVEAGWQADVVFKHAADMRYVGQHYDIMVELNGRPERSGGADWLRRRSKPNMKSATGSCRASRSRSSTGALLRWAPRRRRRISTIAARI